MAGTTYAFGSLIRVTPSVWRRRRLDSRFTNSGGVDTKHEEAEFTVGVLDDGDEA